jgi:hypothetical protein
MRVLKNRLAEPKLAAFIKSRYACQPAFATLWRDSLRCGFADKLSCFNASSFQASVITLKKMQIPVFEGKDYYYRPCEIAVALRINCLVLILPAFNRHANTVFTL